MWFGGNHYESWGASGLQIHFNFSRHCVMWIQKNYEKFWLLCFVVKEWQRCMRTMFCFTVTALRTSPNIPISKGTNLNELISWSHMTITLSTIDSQKNGSLKLFACRVDCINWFLHMHISYWTMSCPLLILWWFGIPIWVVGSARISLFRVYAVRWTNWKSFKYCNGKHFSKLTLQYSAFGNPLSEASFSFLSNDENVTVVVLWEERQMTYVLPPFSVTLINGSGVELYNTAKVRSVPKYNKTIILVPVHSFWILNFGTSTYKKILTEDLSLRKWTGGFGLTPIERCLWQFRIQPPSNNFFSLSIRLTTSIIGTYQNYVFLNFSNGKERWTCTDNRRHPTEQCLLLVNRELICLMWLQDEAIL